MSMTTRRTFLRNIVLTTTSLSVPGVFAQQLLLTPRQTEGPYYPSQLPLDRDNDLIIINDSLTPAVGEITHLSGKILDQSGNPINNALVEIWQTDNNGIYLDQLQNGNRGGGFGGRRGRGRGGYANNDATKWDSNFQGYGSFITGSTGEYYFRTIKPTLYPGRTKHIHFAITTKGLNKWTTQCYVRGEPGNERDSVLRRIGNLAARESVIVDFEPIKGSSIGELQARFDIILGMTPAA